MHLRQLLLGCLPLLAGCAGGVAPTEREAARAPEGGSSSKPSDPVVLRHSDSVGGLAFTPDGRTLITSDHKSIRLWDVASSQERATLKNGNSGGLRVAVSPDGKLIAAGNSDETVRLWDARSGAEIATLTGHAHSVQSVTFSPDSTMLASGSSRGYSGNAEVKLWDLRTRTAVASLPGIVGHLSQVAFSPDGSKLATGSMGSSVILWDVASKKVHRTLKGHTYVTEIVWSPVGDRVVSGGNDIRIWNRATGELITTLPAGDETDTCNGLAISKDGKLFVSGSHRGNVQVRNVSDGQVKLTLQHAPPRKKPTVEPIENLLKSMEKDVHCVALSPDDSLLAAGVGPTVRIWNLKLMLATNTEHPTK